MLKPLSVVTGILLLYLIIPVGSKAQTHTPRYNTTIAYSSHGFYEYLPQGYGGGQEKYPLILFLHGAGEMGNGSPGQLEEVLNLGIPKLVHQGNFPSSFTLNGNTHRFIIISPQFTNWPNAADIDSILNYVILNYRVNINRIYLTGFSMGGGAVWEFAGSNPFNAGRIAAIVPVAGASYPNVARANVIAASNMAVWATHNDGDPLIPVHYTNDYVQYINSAPTPPAIPARKTIFNSNSHNAWSRSYDPSFTENGMNIYQWMLQYSRSLITLPVSLTSYTVNRVAEREVMISWTSAEEFNNARYTIQRSQDGVHFNEIGTVAAQNTSASYSFSDHHPVQGDNYYRLAQTSLNGHTIYYAVHRVRLDTEKHLQLFPNPVADRLRIILDHEEKGNFLLSIHSPDGKLLKQYRFDKQQYSWNQDIDLSSLPAGKYLVSLRGKTFSESRLVFRK